MTYEQTLQSVNPIKALELLKLEATQQGAYLYTVCPDCKAKMAVKAYGESKGLTWCTAEKKGGNLIKLVEQLMKTDTQGAKRFLEKASVTQEKLAEPPQRIYELEYHDFLKERGITEENAKDFGIGVPKGKSMLAGCVAFSVYNDQGTHVAYYGIEMKTGKHKFYHTLNPELYLLYFHRIDPDAPVIFCTDLFDCVRRWEIGSQAVCNFGLPYLSQPQIDMLNRIPGGIDFLVSEERKKDFAVQALELKSFHRFS